MLDRFGWSALSVPAYRVFLLGAGAANAGLFMYTALAGWAALLVTDSSAGVGLVYSAFALPTLLVTAHAGGVADGFGARRTFGVSVAAMGAIMAIIGIASLAGFLNLPVFVGLSLALGVVTALGLPASQSIVGELVPPRAISGAVTLNFVQFAIAKIFGGVVAGIALATLPLGATFLIAAGLSAVLAVPLYRLTAAYAPPRADDEVMADVRDGIRHARGRPTLAAIVVLGLAPGSIAFTYLVILPAAARDVFGVGPDGLGNLLAVTGVGGLAAGLLLEPAQRLLGHGRLLAGGLAVMAGSIALLGIAPNAVVAALALLIVGGAFVVYPSVTITLIQAMAPPGLRGRLVGFFALLYWGSLPVGGVAAGWLAEVVGPRGALVAAGLGTGLFALIAFVLRPELLSLRVDRMGRLQGSAEPAQASSGSASA